MNIFISWSGDRSKIVAEALKQFLQDVIQICQPFVSSKDIEKGTRFDYTITGRLNEDSLGVFCLTQENLKSEWIHFEAGAISKDGDSRAWTMLIDLVPTDVEKPLGNFQHTVATSKDDVLAFLTSVNAKSEQPLSPDRLNRAFNKSWEEFAAEVERAINTPTEEITTPPRDVAALSQETLEGVRELLREKDDMSLQLLTIESTLRLIMGNTDRISSKRNSKSPIKVLGVTFTMAAATSEAALESAAAAIFKILTTELPAYAYDFVADRVTFTVRFTNPVSFDHVAFLTRNFLLTQGISIAGIDNG